MTKLERQYDRKDFVNNGYDLFTKFMFEVCNKVGITLVVTDDDVKDKVVLSAYGDVVEVVRCAKCGHSHLDEWYAERDDPYCYWCNEKDDYFKADEFCSSGVRRPGGAE